METLDAMYPKGYVIIYTCKDGQVRLSVYNPHGYPSIARAHRLLEDNAPDCFDQ